MSDISDAKHDTEFAQYRSAHASELLVVLRQLQRHRGGVIGFWVLVIFVLCTLLAPLLAPYDPLALSREFLAPPSADHLMGTDVSGRDVLSRVLYGGRVSLTVGFIAVGIAAAIGTAVGILGGYLGGTADAIVVMVVDVMMAFPGILLALVIVATLGPNLRNVMIAVGIGNVPTFARMARSVAIAEREKEYVMAARAIGCRRLRVAAIHVLPSVVSPLIVLSTISIGWAILGAASLGFLGLGVQPPTPEWGNMVNAGRLYLREAPWLMQFPGLAIMMVVLGANLLGDALRDALDPKLRV